MRMNGRVGVLCALLAATGAWGRTVEVSTSEGLRTAIGEAQAGDEIVLADGEYTLTSSVSASADGTVEAPITVRAANRHAAKVRVSTQVGFRVSGRHWRFDGLELVGTCATDDACEHALQVTGDAQGFVLRHSRLIDFNAQVKVNAAPDGSGGWDIPHDGLIERNAFFDTRGRQTANPVTKVNIDTGDRWVVRDNLIHDFHKLGGNFISYGAFMKSGGNDGVFERNLVICERDVPSAASVQIGLSFGGGGTGAAFCAPAFDANVPCDPEHSRGVLRNNVIANCSDVGVYLNRAADTKVLFNTLVGTTGVDFRFGSTTGEADGNVLTSVVRGRNGGTFTRGENRENVSVATFTGWYTAPLEGDLSVKGDVTALVGAAPARAEVTDDFCARSRAGLERLTLGAVEHALGDCAVWPGEPPVVPGPDGGMGDPDAGTGTEDAGMGDPDAGTGPVGAADGGPGGDGALPPATSGCGCQGGAGAGGAGGLAVLVGWVALAGVPRRRRALLVHRRDALQIAQTAPRA